MFDKPRERGGLCLLEYGPPMNGTMIRRLGKILGPLALTPITLAISGCGGAPGPQLAPVPLTILEQPQDTTAPLEQPANFRVIAQGTGTLSYQWNQNGIAIEGATGASYSTPPVTTSDTGEKFSVTVRDSKSSLASNAAMLTVGPRSPAAGDLRFKQVDSPSTANGFAGEGFLYLEHMMESKYPNTLGFPLRLGSGICVGGVPQDCAWFYAYVPVPSGVSLNTTYFSDTLENLDSDLNALSTTNSVITSWDIEAGNDVFGMEVMQGPATGFDYKHEVASLSGLQALVANDGANGRVVTAVTFDGSGNASLLSYGWASDKTTVYDAAVATASYDDIPAQATTLANAGYIITAFGGDPTWGYVMVGTRVHGDSLPRPILTFPPAPTDTSINGYSLVGNVGNMGAGDDDSVVWVFEK